MISLHDRRDNHYLPPAADSRRRADDMNAPGWFRMPLDAVRQHGKALGPVGVAVLAAMSSHADRDGVCWPSITTLARETGASRRGVIYAIRKLQELGLVQLTSAGGGKTSNKYRVVALVHTVHGTHAPGALPHAPDARGGCIRCMAPMHLVHPN